MLLIRNRGVKLQEMREWRGFILIAPGRVIAGQGFFFWRKFYKCTHTQTSPRKQRILIGRLVLPSCFKSFENATQFVPLLDRLWRIYVSTFLWACPLTFPLQSCLSRVLPHLRYFSLKGYVVKATWCKSPLTLWIWKCTSTSVEGASILHKPRPQ